MRMKMNVICGSIHRQFKVPSRRVRVSHLHSILNLGHKRTLGNESKELSFDFVWKWYNEADKDHHLCHQKEEDL
jgi:hypothetical protein